MKLYSKLIENSCLLRQPIKNLKENKSIKKANMKCSCDVFLSRLPQNSHILDLEAKSSSNHCYFEERGHQVITLDTTYPICLSEESYFLNTLNFKEVFEGIWAGTSLCYASRLELIQAIKRLEMLLKPEGLLLTCFKYGECEGKYEEKCFIDFNIDTAELYLNTDHLRICSMWRSQDDDTFNKDSYLINIISKKI